MSDFVIKDAKGNEIKVGSFVNTDAELDFEKMPKAGRLEIVKRWNWSNADPEDYYRHMADTYQRAPDGIVTAISDFDGDVDDDTGRPIQINPYVTVRWPLDKDYVEEEYSTSVVLIRHYGPDIDECDIELECGDLVVLYRDYNNVRGIDPQEIYVDVLFGIRKGRLDDHPGSVFDRRSPLTHQSIRQVDADGNPYLDYN